MKILIIGTGWIGEAFRHHLLSQGHEAHGFAPKLKNGIDDIPPTIWNQYEVIVNTAAKTQIDWCEKNKLECFRTNSLIAANLAERCKNTGKRYVFISSACIFESQDREDVKFEDTVPNPQCFYALTKWVAEELVMDFNPDALIVRIRLPLSEKPHPRNTVTKILGYPNLNDNQESVTVIEDMMPVLRNLIEKKEKGIFHLVNAGTVSPHEIGEAFKHPHSVWEKKTQDEYMRERELAHRVTTYVGSKRIALLPDIRKRLPEIVKAYGEAN